MNRSKAKITAVHPADDNHRVLTVEGGGGNYRRKPCSDCPWRTDAVGEFPAQAFRQSANTAYDQAMSSFGCHQSGADKPATCAGFLLKGADHNLSVRFRRLEGDTFADVTDNGAELFEDYTAMAVANGVAEDDLVLKPCRRARP
jgi:hypothetical protein